MKVLAQSGGIAMTNAYLLVDEPSRQCVLVDAPDHTVAPLLRRAHEEKWGLVALWFTHGHFDHTADHAAVTAAFPNTRKLIHALDEPKLRTPGSVFMALPFEIPPTSADAHFEDGQTVAFGGARARVIHTPGHAPGHVCFYFEADELLVGGDLIIGGAVGRTDLPDSDARALAQSVRKVMALPDATRLLPGHGRATTLGEERANNPYVRHILAGNELP